VYLRLRAAFNISSFSYSPEEELAVYDSRALRSIAGSPLRLEQPPSGHMRLPTDLPPRFGEVFNQACFSRVPLSLSCLKTR
jgi:hypothetical protein